MKAITIHGLEDAGWSLLKERVKEQGACVNGTVKGLLEQALGVKRLRQQPHRHDSEEFCDMTCHASGACHESHSRRSCRRDARCPHVRRSRHLPG